MKTLKIAMYAIMAVMLVSVSCKRTHVEQETSNGDHQTGRPNFIVIFLDDVDFDELNVYDYRKFPCYTGAREAGITSVPGSASFKEARFFTPNIDKMTSEGFVFNKFYMSSSICTPVRYSILTGKRPSLAPGFESQFPAGTYGNLQWNIPLLPEEGNIAKILDSLGYVTGIVGKWHNGFGDREISAPSSKDDFKDPEIKQKLLDDYQFMISYLTNEIGFAVADRIVYKNPPFSNLEWMTEGVLNFIDEQREKPFYMYFAIPYPHAQYYKNNDWEQRYTPYFELEEDPQGMKTYPECVKENKNQKLEKRNALATWLDASIGAIIDKTIETGIENNTVIILLSDHQTRGKYTCFEGCRVPCIIKYPPLTKQRTEIDQLCQLTDLVPTILNITDSEYTSYGFDGTSLLPLLQGKTDVPWRDHVLVEVNYSKAIVTSDWKYIANRPPPPAVEAMKEEAIRCAENGQKRQIGWDGNVNPHPQYDDGGVRYGADRDFPDYFDADQLFNLKDDVFEQHNLAHDPQYQPIIENMKLLLKQKLEPSKNLFGEFTPEQADTLHTKKPLIH